MESPATLSRPPARPQARADDEAYTDAWQDAKVETGPHSRRPPGFYSLVFTQIEEIGWEQVVSATGDDGVPCLTFRVVGCVTDYTCENPSCSRAFHSVCLRDWLRSITSTRQSFDVLFGNCPYCSDPVAVKITDH